MNKCCWLTLLLLATRPLENMGNLKQESTLTTAASHSITHFTINYILLLLWDCDDGHPNSVSQWMDMYSMEECLGVDCCHYTILTGRNVE